MIADLLTPGLSMCPIGECSGQLYEMFRFGQGRRWHCTMRILHNFADTDLAACTRCDVPQASDRLTVDQALTGHFTDRWLRIDGLLVCPDHLGWCMFNHAYDMDNPESGCGRCADHHQPCVECL